MRWTKMDKKITIKRSTSHRTATGGLKQGTPSEVFTDWCMLKPVEGIRKVEYGQHNHTKVFDVFLSNRPEEVRVNDLAYIDGEEYQITEPPYITSDKRFIKFQVER